jgi:hypothetical protein
MIKGVLQGFGLPLARALEARFDPPFNGSRRRDFE